MYPCKNKESCANGTAHAPKEDGIFELALAVDEYLTTDWRPCQGRESGEREGSTSSDSDLLYGRNLSCQNWREANPSTRSNTEKRGKQYYWGVAGCWQPQSQDQNRRESAHKDHGIETAGFVCYNVGNGSSNYAGQTLISLPRDLIWERTYLAPFKIGTK